MTRYDRSFSEPRFDRLITVTRRIVTGRVRGKAQFRETTQTLWARQLPLSARDQLETDDGSSEIRQVRMQRWQVRWQAGISWRRQDRFTDDDGNVWNVTGMQELGRRFLVELLAQTQLDAVRDG